MPMLLALTSVSAQEATICCYQLPESGTRNIDYTQLLMTPDSQPIGSLPFYYQYTINGINISSPGSRYSKNEWLGIEIIDTQQLYEDMTLYCTRTQGHSLTFRVGTVNQIEFTYQPGRCQGDTLFNRALRNVKNDKS